MAIIWPGINGRLSEGHGGVHQACCMGGQLGSAAHPSLLLQHKRPPFSTMCKNRTPKHQPVVTPLLCLLQPFVEGALSGRSKRQHPQNVWRSQRRAVCYSSLCALALSLSQTHSRSLSRWIHLQCRIGGQGGCSDWNSTQIVEIKTLLTAEKSRLIHRSLQEDFRWVVVAISPSVCVCVWVFSYYGERIVVGNPSLPIRELLSPPCVQMMTMATKLRSQ